MPGGELAAIEACKVVKEPLLALGGGIKRFRGAWAYTLWGQGTRVVRIEWHDARGAKETTLVSSPDPDALADAIQRARDAAAARSGARVEVEPAQVPSEAGSQGEAEEAARRVTDP